MSGYWLDEFGRLDGAELQQLIDKLARARVTIAVQTVIRRENGLPFTQFAALESELGAVWNDVCIQVCRITAPVDLAQRLITQSQRRHRAPVLVPGVT